MLIFIPTYDIPTSQNLAVVCNILPNATVQLVAEQATRANLLQAIEHSESVFAMSHGSSDALWDSEETTVLTLADASIFKHKKVFVFACYTANELGEAFKNAGAIYWGYTGVIQSPSSLPDKIPVFEPLFRYIIEQFASQTTAETITLFLNKVKNLCDAAAYQMDEIDPFDTESFRSLNDTWSRLRVKHCDFIQPFVHPEAQVGDLLY